MANGHQIKLIFFGLFLFSKLVVCRTRGSKSVNRFEGYEDEDPIKLTRCDVSCFGANEREKCHNDCMTSSYTKLGFCPLGISFENLSIFEKSCQDYCTDDNQCPGTQKCCLLTCGTSSGNMCQHAAELSGLNELPAVPWNVTALDRGRRIVGLTWKMPPMKSDQVVYYVVQERHHQGRHFSEPQLGRWNTIYSSQNKTIALQNVLRLVHWYQFRVAAVNKNGTKGYSEPSKEFTLSCCPAGLIPKRPRKLRVEKIEERNGKIRALIRWNRAKSEIPIMRYRILLHKKLDSRSDSTITFEFFVPKNQLWYQLENLEKDTLYFIQVRAQGLYGKSHQNGREAQMVFNTSNFMNQYEDPKLTRKYKLKSL